MNFRTRQKREDRTLSVTIPCFLQYLNIAGRRASTISNVLFANSLDDNFLKRPTSIEEDMNNLENICTYSDLLEQILHNLCIVKSCMIVLVF